MTQSQSDLSHSSPNDGQGFAASTSTAVDVRGDASTLLDAPSRDATVKAIREHGGIVHGDGNIFFTNVEQFRCAARASTPVAALRESEQREILRNPEALLLLMDYHDVQQEQADSMGAECYGDILRYDELRKLGRAIIEADPEIWSDELRRRFLRRRFFEHDEWRAAELARAKASIAAPSATPESQL